MKILKMIGIVVLVVVVLAGAGVTTLALKKPAQRPAPDVKVEITPERLARGKYLVENVVDCVGCHSDHEWDKFGMPEWITYATDDIRYWNWKVWWYEPARAKRLEEAMKAGTAVPPAPAENTYWKR